MKKSLKLLFSSLAAVLGIGAASGVCFLNSKTSFKIHAIESKATDYACYALGLPSWDASDDNAMLDSDGDGIYTFNYTFPSGNSEFKVMVNGSWFGYNNLVCIKSYENGVFTYWGAGGDGQNIGVYSNVSIALTVCVRADNQAIYLIPQADAAESFKTIYCINTTGSSGTYNNPRIHFWSDDSGFGSIWATNPSMINENTTYASVGTNTDSGDLYSYLVPFTTENVIIRDANGTVQTADQDVTEKHGVVVGHYDTTTWAYTFWRYIPDGYYVVGTYKGVENWNYGVEPVVGESITDNGTDSNSNGTNDEIYLSLELSAGDTFKIARYHSNSTAFDYIGAKSISSAESTYFPVTSPSDSNIYVANAGVYYMTLTDVNDIYNSNEYRTIAARSSAYQFFDEFLGAMSCSTGEPIWDPEKKSWSDFADWYTYTLDSYAKHAFATITPVAGSSNIIEDGLARYFLLVNRRGYSPFITTTDGETIRTYGANSGILLGFANIQKNGTSIAIIVTTSLVAFATIGGYFFIRRRKEN